MSTTNTTGAWTRSAPSWYLINDCLVILFSTVGISITVVFVYAVVRLDHPTYSIANLVACKTCIAIGLLSTVVVVNSCMAVADDWQGSAPNDASCLARGILVTTLHINMYISLCFKAFNRLRYIVYRIRPVTKSYQCLLLLTLLQWLVVALLVLPIIASDGIGYDWHSHLCVVTTSKTWQLIYLMIIYYISIAFIAGAYVYILYYVLHLSALERFRRQRQRRLLRRIVILLLMLILPGVFYFGLTLHSLLAGRIPAYSLTLTGLVDSIGRTGVAITIFISNTRLRRQCYKHRHKRRSRGQRGHLYPTVSPPPRPKLTFVASSFTLERPAAHAGTRCE